MKNADLVLQNGKIYTIDAEDRIAEAVAVQGGKIVAVGSNQEVAAFIGPETEVVDAGGNLVLPGFIEPHVHMPGNAYNVLYNINLFDAKTEAETMDTIREFVAQHPEQKIYYGRGFMSAAFPGVEAAIGPRKERLDAICPDKPVVIADFGGHVIWLNSKALEEFAITEETPEVPGGVIEKDPKTGKLWGILKEEAKCLYPDQEFTLEQKVGAAKYFQKEFNKYGYTSVFGMRPSACSDPRPIFPALEVMEAEGQLSLRVFGGREIKVGLPEDPQLEELISFKNKYTGDQIKAVTAKYFIDGAVEGVSAFLSEPYKEACGKGGNYYGESLWDQERLVNTFIKTLQAGLNIHVHAIGDEAVSKTIDALEIAQSKVPGDHRNSITHLQVVKPEDIERMKRLNIIACVNTYWHLKDPCVYFEAELPFLGEERAEKEYPLGSFVRSGVRITSSGDHPITPYPNPFFAIEVGVTRNMYNAKFFKVADITDMDDPTWLLGKEERVSVMDMVRAYTINGAYASYQDDIVGSIEVGKFADMIVIDQDIFAINPIDIEFTKVLKTIFNGKVIYEEGK